MEVCSAGSAIINKEDLAITFGWSSYEIYGKKFPVVLYTEHEWGIDVAFLFFTPSPVENKNLVFPTVNFSITFLSCVTISNYNNMDATTENPGSSLRFKKNKS